MKQLEFGEKNVRVRWAGVKEYFGEYLEERTKEVVRKLLEEGVAGGVSILRPEEFEEFYLSLNLSILDSNEDSMDQISLLQIPAVRGKEVA
jgi:hypothetical protein